MPRLPAFLLLIVLVLCCCLVPETSANPPPSKAIEFARDIEKIFRQHCYSCHGPQRQRSGLRLDRKKEALQGGNTGLAIVPGKTAASPLLQRVQSSERSQRMPPEGDRLTPQQIDLLRAWIEQGASWPQTVASAGISPGEHWSFQSVSRPALPPVKNSVWVRNPIDRFILARLEDKGLTPNPEADRVTLIRRLKFDLLGLPPTPAEVDAFVSDRAADAYEKLVEQYLHAPQHGERWARHWLDVVRFAESDGFETNQPRRNAWPYRDYVIRAFNEDRPYDRFILEQLAGDALDVEEATAFLVGGPVDRVKSPDVALTLQQRADELNDMIGTTATAFLGLTVGCARCHDHKFDPVSHLDYHGMKAIFAGVQHGERLLRGSDPVARAKAAEAIRQELARVEAELFALEPLARPDGPPARAAVSPRTNVERFPPVRARFIRFVVLATNNAEPCIDELEVYSSGPNPVNLALATVGSQATSSGNYSGNPKHKLGHVNDGQYGNSRSWISNQVGQGWIQIELKEPALIDRVVWGRDREGVYSDRLAVRYRIEVAVEADTWKVVASSNDRLPAGTAATAPPGLSPADTLAWNRLTARRTQLLALPREPMVYAGVFTTPETVQRLHRGDPMQKREPVAPAALSLLGPKLQLPMNAPEQQRRLALAKWIADPQHPLTARVMVNRLWHYHFGTGIVSTPSDLGRNGGKPSHPELLDWLASEFANPSPHPLPEAERGQKAPSPLREGVGEGVFPGPSATSTV